MSINPQDWVQFQQRQTDIKGFLNVLAPFINSSDIELKIQAENKAKELISEMSLTMKESVIKPV